MSAFERAHLRFYFEELRGGTFAVGAPTDHVQKITGRPPESFETAAPRYIAQPDLIYPGLRARTKLEALAFMAKMILTPVPDLAGWERDRGHPILREPLPTIALTGGKLQSRRSCSFYRLPTFANPFTLGPALDTRTKETKDDFQLIDYATGSQLELRRAV